ncbi:hypothetical protein NKJ33_32180, partial [Mesorhizobium sp. M0155]|uniref:hypothetical protein n=1 Tax=Mesorhizobium sp. M0155 TaxID=2956899 RepID=UPI00333ABEF8
RSFQGIGDVEHHQPAMTALSQRICRTLSTLPASLIATIFTQPSLAALRHNLHALRYRWREPPRKRKFQSMPKLS